MLQVLTSPAFIFGLIASVCMLIYISTLPPPSKSPAELEMEEERKKPHGSLKRRERREQLKQAFVERIKTFNPEAKDMEIEDLVKQSKERQSAFLSKLDPAAKEVFLNSVKMLKKEMKKIERMSEEELESKMIEIEANNFRICICKILIVLFTITIMAGLFYQTSDIWEIADRFSDELKGYMPSMMRANRTSATFQNNISIIDSDL